MTVLEVLGLEPVDEQVYDLLLTQGRMLLTRIGAETGLSPDVLRKSIDVLVEKGLVRQLAGSDQEFVVAPPEYAIEVLIAEQMGALQAVRAAAPDLAARVRRAALEVDPTGLVEIIAGVDGVRQVYLQVLKTAKSEIAIFDSPPYALGVTEVAEQQEERMSTDRLRLRTVFDTSLLEDPVHVRRIMRGIAAGEQGRIARVPLKLMVADRELAMLPLLHAGSQTPEAAILVHRSVLLDSLIALFDSVWENAAEISAPSGAESPAATEDDYRQLAQLLAAGMTDTAIARYLGVSERTIRRRIKELLGELRAQSRFQAGVRAADRGWI